ncbi:4-hydroxy-2-oxoheptanedioate aldolase [Pigmentiphaga soli]|uniref:4-hydroxy-2-oxoheptanedioate aldolase n=1 Tax=Pigmentiphaga soli TaxID=1007095 RepID=A0ABP8GQ13_9BURK
MASYDNPYKRKLAGGQPMYGIYCFIPAFQTVEILSHSGLDYLLLDIEHSPTSLPVVHQQLAAMRGSGMSAAVRIPAMAPEALLPYLDLGIQNFVFTGVTSTAGAQAAVAATRYPPAGRRGIGARMRAVGYRPDDGYFGAANGQIAVGIQIETRQACDELDAICAIDGVDLITFGPQDLAADCGLLGQPRHPEVEAMIDAGLRRARRNGKAAGMTALTEDDARRYAAAGANVLTVGADIAMLRGQAEALHRRYVAPAAKA